MLVRFWVLALRLTGVAIIALSILGQGYVYSQNAFQSDTLWITYSSTLVESLALALLCFGAASALVCLKRLEARNDQQREYLRMLTEGKRRRATSLAPVAPDDYDPVKPLPYDQRVAAVHSHSSQQLIGAANDRSVQYVIGQPTERIAPEPINYNAGRRQRPNSRMPYEPPTREDRRAGRDAQLRRQQNKD